MSAPETSTAPKEPPPPPEIPNLDKKVLETELMKKDSEVKAENKQSVLQNPGTNDITQENIANVGVKPNEQVNIETKQTEEVKVDAKSEVGIENVKEKPAEVIKQEEIKVNSDEKNNKIENKEENKEQGESTTDKPTGLVEINDNIESPKQNDTDKVDSLSNSDASEEKKKEHIPTEAIVSEEKKLSDDKPLITGIIETGNQSLKTTEQIPTATTVDSSINNADSKKDTNVPENKDLPVETVQNESLTNEPPPTQESGEKKESDEPKTETGGNEEEIDEDCVNMQEMIEQVMNIINDGVASENSNRQELLKKNLELQQFIVKLIHLLKEKTDLCVNLDRQNSALISQAKSLKDVIAITKDLLGIRNMEVEHLRSDLDSMQESIQAERNRHNTAVQHLSEAMGLNDKLKAEYLTQMDLFEKLKEKYTEKVVILTRENIRLNALMQENGIDTSATISGPVEQVEANPDPSQSESVDK